MQLKAFVFTLLLAALLAPVESKYCGKGKYCNSRGRCRRCPLGTWSPGGDNIKECFQCPDGSRSTLFRRSCSCGHNSKHNQDTNTCDKKCPAHSSPNDYGDCVCDGNRVMGPLKLKCHSCPANTSPNDDGTACECNPGFTKNHFGKCVCPQNSHYDESTSKCQCEDDFSPEVDYDGNLISCTY